MKKKTSVRKYVIVAYVTFTLVGILFFLAMAICLKQGRFAPAILYSVPSIIMISVASNMVIFYNLLVSAGLLSPSTPLVPLWGRRSKAEAQIGENNGLTSEGERRQS